MMFLHLFLMILIILPHYCHSNEFLHSFSPSHNQTFIITLSWGRSGSDFIIDVIRNIFHIKHDVNIGSELFGYSTKTMSNQRNHTEEMLKHFYHTSYLYPHSPILGFKWKPYVINSDYNEVWKYIATQSHEKWKIIHNIRNHLDVRISQKKHEQFKLPAHCPSIDKVCINKMKNSLPILDPIDTLNYIHLMNMKIQYLTYYLRSLGLNIYEVKYEDIGSGSYRSRLIHLQALSEFLLYPNHEAVDTSLLHTAVGATSTGESQSDKVANWQELYDVFINSSYSYLLRP